LTTRDGQLLALVGRELKNAQTETWLNYAIPLSATADIRDGENVSRVSMAQFVEKAMKGQYKTRPRVASTAGTGAYHGIIFVPNILERTPPYIDATEPNSPAAKAGLKPNDLVSFVDGEPIGNIRAFQEAIKKLRAGTVIKVEIRRGDKLQNVELKLEDFPKPKKP
jgi:serine protease Do